MKLLKCKDYKEEIHLKILGYVLVLPIVIDFLSVIVQQRGMSGSSVITMMVYLFSLIIILFKLIRIVSIRELANDLILYVILLFPFIFNYIIFKNTRSNIISQEMLIIYIFFFLLIAVSVRKISRWDLFFDALIEPGMVAITLAVIILLFLNYERYLVYMGFSYALLPFICNFYRMTRVENVIYKKLIYVLFFAIGLLCILVFGARAAIGFALLYVVVFEVFRNDVKLIVKVISILLLLVVIVLLVNNIDVLAAKMMHMPAFKDSYFLKNLISGQLLESKTRDVLYESCKRRMSTMGLSVSGFFGDREYCAGFAYPHNIFYEIIMSYGWIFGCIAIVIYIGLLLKGILSKNSTKREVTVFILITMLARYLISGSYLIEGKFWIASTLVVVIALKNVLKVKNNA